MNPVGKKNWFQREQGTISTAMPWNRSDRPYQVTDIPNNRDLLDTPSIFFYETGYSTHVLRQASRRSWRIGQQRPVRVCYMSYAETAQERCLRLMGKKMQVSSQITAPRSGLALVWPMPPPGPTGTGPR